MQNRYSEIGFVQQILGLNLVPRKNGTNRGNDTSLSDFSEMWYGVFLWAAVSSLVFHLPAALLSLATLRQHKMARFMPIAILLMGIVGPVFGGVLTSAAIAGFLPLFSSAETHLVSYDAARNQLPYMSVVLYNRLVLKREFHVNELPDSWEVLTVFCKRR